jgi:hypothetical protein
MAEEIVRDALSVRAVSQRDGTLLLYGLNLPGKGGAIADPYHFTGPEGAVPSIGTGT